MICTNCGTENVAGRKFCANCGARLAIVCANCGASNAPGDRFCGECGTQLDVESIAPGIPVGAVAGAAPAASPAVTPAASPAVAATPVAERRLVSILFADLVGFTTYSESRDAEEVREMLGRYFDAARDVIDRYGGTVEKFIGDAVMAVWGAPVAREDDAERAVRAALELLDAVRALTPPEAPEADRLHLRAGVLTGEAAVTLGAVGQGMVAGDLVNTASRLQSVAPSDTVLVGDSTYRATKESIAYEAVGEQQLKGKVAPVPAWRATQVVALRGGEGRSERLEAPFVGRESEFRLLKDLLTATQREGRLRLVSVTGIAGIGKSRLAWEFLKYIDGLVEDVYWHQGRSPAYGEGVTFWALGEMVRRRAGIAELDDEATTRQKLGAALADFVPEEADRRWMAPSLEALLGLADAPPGERDETFAAWRGFFERVAMKGATVLVFEELHWADSGLLDFIESMLEWSRVHPILIVTLARPELLERRPTWGAGQRNFVAVHLEPLDEPAMRDLLGGLAPGLPETVVRGVLERAEGVPLYAVETVRMLVDTGGLTERDGTYEVAADISRLAVPETLQALIAARIDGLDPGERALVQDAAILGQSFTVTALAALAGHSPSELEEPLRGLVRKEVLVLDADPRSPERGQYGFVQSLIREVAHETISKRDRKTKHLAAARYFEALGEDELAGVLASHYLQAYEATSPGAEADALAAQARVALRAAADRASALYSHEQALAFLEQAERVTADPAEQVALWERIAAAGRAAARYDVAEARLKKAIAWHREQDEPVAVAQDTVRLADVLLSQRSIDAALELFAGPPMGGLPARDAARLSSIRGRTHMLNSEYDRALPLLEEALALSTSAEDVETVAETLASKGPVLGELGRLDEGIAVLHGAIALGESHGLVSTRFRASYNLAGRLYPDDPASAYRVLRDALDLSRRLGQRGWLLSLAAFCIGAAVDAGDWDSAMTLSDEVAQGDVPPADRLSIAVWEAQILAYRGRDEEAAALLADVAPILEEFGNDSDRGAYWWSRSSVAFAAGRFDEAYDAGIMGATVNPTDSDFAYGLAAGAAVLLGDRERLAGCVENMERKHQRGRLIDAYIDEYRAALLAFDARREEATRLYADVIRRLQGLGVVVRAAIATLEAVAVIGVEEPTVAAAADEARGLYTKLGARAMLARLDEAIARGPFAPAEPTTAAVPRAAGADRVVTSPPK